MSNESFYQDHPDEADFREEDKQDCHLDEAFFERVRRLLVDEPFVVDALLEDGCFSFSVKADLLRQAMQMFRLIGKAVQDGESFTDLSFSTCETRIVTTEKGLSFCLVKRAAWEAFEGSPVSLTFFHNADVNGLVAAAARFQAGDFVAFSIDLRGDKPFCTLRRWRRNPNSQEYEGGFSWKFPFLKCQDTGRLASHDVEGAACLHVDEGLQKFRKALKFACLASRPTTLGNKGMTYPPLIWHDRFLSCHSHDLATFGILPFVMPQRVAIEADRSVPLYRRLRWFTSPTKIFLTEASVLFTDGQISLRCDATAKPGDAVAFTSILDEAVGLIYVDQEELSGFLSLIARISGGSGRRNELFFHLDVEGAALTVHAGWSLPKSVSVGAHRLNGDVGVGAPTDCLRWRVWVDAYNLLPVIGRMESGTVRLGFNPKGSVLVVDQDCGGMHIGAVILGAARPQVVSESYTD